MRTIKQEKIWDAAKAGDTKLLKQNLVGATEEDFKFENGEVGK
jgi:hypothetical protein